jgi:hypothetical protein
MDPVSTLRDNDPGINARFWGGQEAIEQAAHHDRAAIEQYPRILQVALICELV